MDTLFTNFFYLIVVPPALKITIVGFLLLCTASFLLFLFVKLSRDRLIRHLCRDWPIPTADFPDMQVVINAPPIARTVLYGAVLHVPHGAKALMSPPPTGNPEIYKEGEHVIHFHTLFAFVQYVDIRRRTNRFQTKQVVTRDGFKTSLEGKITWRVVDEANVVGIDKPVQEILNDVEKAVRSIVIEYYDHDQIVAAPGREPAMIGELTQYVSRQIEQAELFKFIKLHSLTFNKIEGDPDRIAPPPEPTEAEIMRENLQNRLKLAELERDVAIHEGYIAQDRAIVESQIRMTQAETAVQEELILRAVRERAVDLELKRERPRLELEREKLHINGKIAVMAPATQMFTQLLSAATNGNGHKGHLNAGDVSRVIEDFIVSFPESPNIVTAEYRDGPRPPKNAREELNFQMMEVMGLDGYVGHRFQENKNGYWLLEINLSGNKIFLAYNLSGTQPKLLGIRFINSKDQVFQDTRWHIYSRLKLVQIVRKLVEQYGS